MSNELISKARSNKRGKSGSLAFVTIVAGAICYAIDVNLPLHGSLCSGVIGGSVITGGRSSSLFLRGRRSARPS